jgi:exosortase
LKPAGIYCCEPAVLDFIRPESYQDLKEQLVPNLQGAGLRVGAVTLRKPACQVSDWRSYNYVLYRALSEGRFQTEGYRELAPGIWCGEEVSVAPDARIVGPALLGHRCRIDGGATVIGPTMLADECHIGTGSWLIRTIAPDRVHCPAGACFIDRFVTERHATQPALPSVQVGEAAPPTPDSAAGVKTTARSRLSAILAQPLLPVAALTGVFVWAFWHTISNLWQVWRTDADYSAGQLVPLAAVYMIATRRKLLEGVTLGVAPVGLMVFAVGLAVNLLGGYYLYSSLENVGMLVCLNGLALGLIGWSTYRHIWHPMVFLFLMLPLPNRVHDAVLLPLQGMGARISASVLEIIGIPAVRAGHVLEVGGYRVAVAEACSGLRMAVAFLIVTAVFAYFVQRPRWQKVLVLLSSIPIAIACNVVRVVAAAWLYTAGHGWMAQGAFHDLTGLLMVPMALLLVLAELWLLSRLIAYKDTVTAFVHGTDRTPVVTGH